SSSTSVENSESIPADLIVEIFSRLTAKSLSRFRCLSREWASIFCSRNFTHSFLTRSSARPRLLFTFYVDDDAEQHKWSKKTYILPPFWKNLGVDTRLNVVGMTGDSEIVFSPSILSDPFYIFYYNAERNTTVKVRIQGIDFVKNQYIYTFIDHAEDICIVIENKYFRRCLII
ncbi:unnamed protein product, partial [Brassica napus]